MYYLAIFETKIVEIRVLKLFFLVLLVCAIFSYFQVDWEKCKCYTLPVLKEWIDDPRFTGKTQDYTLECNECKKRNKRKW